jgi:hypothetical protein
MTNFMTSVRRLSLSTMADQNLLPARKPRNRHSPDQLAALNRLYEEDDHPPLSKRVALAESLGM